MFDLIGARPRNQTSRGLLDIMWQGPAAVKQCTVDDESEALKTGNVAMGDGARERGGDCWGIASGFRALTLSRQILFRSEA